MPNSACSKAIAAWTMPRSLSPPARCTASPLNQVLHMCTNPMDLLSPTTRSRSMAARCPWNSQERLFVQGRISLVLTLRQLSREMQSRGVQGYPYYRNVQNVSTHVWSPERNRHTCSCGFNGVMGRAQTLLWLKVDSLRT